VRQSFPLAFYAPLKSPNHPAPSGDRAMARLLMKALKETGFEPELASELRTLDKAGDAGSQERLRFESETAASQLIERYRARPSGHRPRLWFTYHVYYKAPDWIGPRVADGLGIPYAIAEGSRAPKRSSGPWALAHRGAETALDRADAIFVMTPQDREGLERAQPPAQSLVDLPPFVDRRIDDAGRKARFERPEPRLLAVAMMRDGDKLASYRILADAFGYLMHLPWTLDIVGDGEARANVEELFAPIAQRVRFRGQIEDEALLRTLYAEADLLVWPAVNEAYGMVFLEAQSHGCPAVAGAYGGVASVVRHGETGLLAPPGDAVAFAETVGVLLADRDMRRRFGLAAERFVRDERGPGQAAQRLGRALLPLVTGGRP
jgi:glycosyltransferase involved in cell wall biosynthesis